MADVPTYSPNEDALEFQSTGWQKAYLAAILETNNSNLPERIRDAEDAIVARKQQWVRVCSKLPKSCRQSRMHSPVSPCSEKKE
jgi:hypothetical protein